MSSSDVPSSIETNHQSGRELVPAPWTLTERERQLLEGANFDTFPKRFQSDLRRVRDSRGIQAETEAFKMVLAWRRTRADLFKAINDEREEEMRSEKLQGEETEIMQLRRDVIRWRTEAGKATQERDQQTRLKEIAIAKGGDLGGSD